MHDRTKYLYVKRQQGIFYRQDADITRKILLSLRYRYGLSYREIARMSGVKRSTLSDTITGRVKTSNPETIAALRRVQPHGPRGGRYQGARLSGDGTRRRLDALQYEGWTWEAVAAACGVSSRALKTLSGDPERCVTPAVAVAVAGLYADTPTLSLPPQMQARARFAARRRDAAPRHCWDPDTIDDPSAIAEWTGMCGTVQGYRIHQREEGKAHWKWLDGEKKKGRWVIGCAPCRDSQKN